MKATSSYRSLCLLLTLVSGGIVAPFSHYLYMAASAAFAPAEECAGHHAPTSGHSNAASPNEEPGGGASAWETPPPACAYDELFATFAAGTPASTHAFFLPIPRPVDTVSSGGWSDRSVPILLFSRGPPHVPAA